MLGFRWRLALMIFIASTSMVVLADDPPKKPDPAAKLKEIDKQIAAKPDDPLLHAARPQLLAKAGKCDEAYAAAQLAMKKFIAADKELAWIMLDTLEVDGHMVSVHFNMGADERAPPKLGIVRPISFRVY